MKKMIIPAIAALVVSGAQAKTADERIKELEQRIETLEYKSYENYFTFGGRLENQYEYIQAKDNNTDDEAGHDYFSSLFQFNIMATPSDRLTFFGRLSMTKYWNNAQNAGEYDDTTLSLGRAKSDSTPYVERAFINYKMTPSFTLSAGRLPTVDGTPTHYRMNTSSMGSYPALSYATILDGIAVTHSATVLGGSLTSRAVYSPIIFADHDSGQRVSPVETKDSEGNAINNHAPMLALMADYEKFRTSFADRFNLMVQALHMKGSELGSSKGDDYSALGLGQGYKPMVSNVEFDLTKVIAAIEVNNILKSKFDFSAQIAWSKVDSRGKATGYPLIFNTTSGDLQTLPGAAVAAGDIGGIYTDSDKGTSTGWAYLTSIRYNATNNLKMGYEYIQTTNKAFLLTESDRRATSFYSTPGSQGHHAYINYRFDNNFALLGGYTYQMNNTSYTRGLFGSPDSKDHTIQSVYTNLIATF